MAQGVATSHTFRGQISSVQLDDAGNPSWIQSGIWVMRILQAGDDSEPPRVQLVARFVMVMPDGNAMHGHNLYGFNVENYTVDEAMTHTFEGTATVIYYEALVTDQQELASITWPVLGIFGSEDQVISVDSVNQFEAALDANGTTNEIYIYEGVGHAFANPSNAGHAPEETADAWEKTLNFLSEHV